LAEAHGIRPRRLLVSGNNGTLNSGCLPGRQYNLTHEVSQVIATHFRAISRMAEVSIKTAIKLLVDAETAAAEFMTALSAAFC
jgi:hypothetical protein